MITVIIVLGVLLAAALGYIGYHITGKPRSRPQPLQAPPIYDTWADGSPAYRPAPPRKIRSDSHAQLCIPILQAANRLVNERDLFVQTGLAERKQLKPGSPQYKAAQRSLRTLLVSMADQGRTFIYHHTSNGAYYFQLIGFQQQPDNGPEPDPRDAQADARSDAENDAWGASW